MPASQVLTFQDYKHRRHRRFEQALALYSADAERAHLLRYLWSAAAVANGDRAAVVWVDEYGPGLVHAHVILDLISDRPRRAFPAEPLRQAWAEGVPGVFDACGREKGPVGSRGFRNICAVALGSDGLRAWFVVVDGQTPRPRLPAEALAQLMFLAGECSAVLMHKDMRRPEDNVLVPEGGPERFAGWPILKDIEGNEKNDEVSRRISCRFLVARVVRALLDDDLATDREALEHQIASVRRELGRQFVGDAERILWEAVLDAASHEDRIAFAAAVLGLGESVEDLRHLSGAREFYRSAYEAAVATGCQDVALDAARFAARAWRASSEWERALSWYTVARGLARAVGDLAREALVLDGVAKVHKERGNLPRARQVLDEALELALRSGDRHAAAATYHDLSAIAGLSGQTDEAIRLGWRAVTHYQREQDKLTALTSLGASLLEAGELEAAENAYAVVARRSQSPLYRLYALSGYARVAGLRGLRKEYERRLAVLEEAGFAEGPAVFRAGDWLDRAQVYRRMGDLDQARACVRKAMSVAEAHRLGQFIMQAEDAWRTLDAALSPPAAPPLLPVSSIAGLEEMREELSELRESSPVLAGV